jgi:hypothetical protein
MRGSKLSQHSIFLHKNVEAGKKKKKKKSLRVEVEICFPIIIFWTFQGKTWTVLLAWSLFFSVLIVFWDYFQDYHVLLNII